MGAAGHLAFTYLSHFFGEKPLLKYANYTLLSAFLVLSACAETSVTPLSNNQILLHTSVDSDCSKARAASVASQMAAIETLRRGFERYLIQNASTSSSYAPILIDWNLYDFGSKDAELQVLMLNPGDRDFNKAVDAKTTLGPEWKTLVEKGINSCL